MSKQAFTQEERLAFYNAYDSQCFYCGHPIFWNEFEIEHIIEEKYITDQEAYEKIAQEIKLPRDFDILGYPNLVPTHRDCNRKKNLSPMAALYFLDRNKRYLQKLQNEIINITTKKKRGNILSKIGVSIETSLISSTDVLRTVEEAQTAIWQKEPIKLAEGIDFVGEIFDEWEKSGDLETLYDKPLAQGFVIPFPIEGTTVNTIREFKNALDNGYSPGTTPEIKEASVVMYLEELIETLKIAKYPKISYLDNPYFDLSKVSQMSPTILWHPDEECHNNLINYAQKGKSIGQLIMDGVIKIKSYDPIGGLELRYEGWLYLFVEQFRADLNDDGIEDIFVRYWERASGGTFGAAGSIVLTRYSTKHLVERAR